LLQSRLIHFEVHGLTKYHTLHYLDITYCDTCYDVRTLLCVLSVTSFWRQEFEYPSLPPTADAFTI